MQFSFLILSLLLFSNLTFGNVSSFGADKEFTGQVVYEDEKTGTQVMELERVPSEVFSWTWISGLDGILRGRGQDGTFGRFESRNNSAFKQNFPQALERKQGLLFNTVHPLSFRGGITELYGDVLMKVHLKNDRPLRAIRVISNWKEPQDAFKPLITGQFDFREIDLVYNDSRNEWIILNPAIIAGITADPDALRPELEDWIKRLQQPDFKPPKGYPQKEYEFSFKHPQALRSRADAIVQIAKLYGENRLKIKEVLHQHQVSNAISMGHEQSSFISDLATKLSRARDKTELLALLIPSWSDLASNPDTAIARFQKEISDFTLAQIAMNLDQEPLAEKIWNVLAKRIASDTKNAEIHKLYRDILGIELHMTGVKFAIRLLYNHQDDLERKPELLAILLETKGYGMFDDLFRFSGKLEELSRTRGEPWVHLKSVIADAQKNKSSNQDAAQNFRKQLGRKTPALSCKNLFSGGK